MTQAWEWLHAGDQERIREGMDEVVHERRRRHEDMAGPTSIQVMEDKQRHAHGLRSDLRSGQCPTHHC